MVVDHRRAELDEVEEGVAAHERVGGPHDRADAPLERPAALELLEREADRPALEARSTPVMCECRWSSASVEPEEPERDADQAVAVEGAGDEVPACDERPQQARRSLRLAVVVPDAGDRAASTRRARRPSRAAGRRCPRAPRLVARSARGSSSVRAMARIVPRVARRSMVTAHKLRAGSLASPPNVASGCEPTRIVVEMAGRDKLVRDLRVRTPEMVEALRSARRGRVADGGPGCVPRRARRSPTGSRPSCSDRAVERLEVDGRVHLRWRFGGRGRVLLIGHLDTVWPLGTLAPVAVRGARRARDGPRRLRHEGRRRPAPLRALPRSIRSTASPSCSRPTRRSGSPVRPAADRGRRRRGSRRRSCSSRARPAR